MREHGSSKDRWMPMLMPAAPTTALIESHAQQRRKLENTVISATPTRELAMPHKQVPSLDGGQEMGNQGSASCRWSDGRSSMSVKRIRLELARDHELPEGSR